MKAAQYVTSAYGEMRPMELRPVSGSIGSAAKLELGVERQAVEGFGVALTGSSCYWLSRMPEKERRAFLNNVYGKEGLNLSMARLSIGSSDYSPELYTYDDGEADPSLRSFSIRRDEDYVIPMIQEVLAVRPELFLYAAPWTPPAWMKTGASLCGGHMREKYVDCYAEYFIRFLKAYAEKGIHVQAVNAQNEPETDQAGQMPACRWNPDTEAHFLMALHEKLQREQLNTRLWMFDHCYDGWRRVWWMLTEYPELQKICDAAAFHYYDLSIEKLEELRRAYPDFPWHFTEGGPRINFHYSDDWCKWGIVISKAFRYGSRSFTGWNLLLDETGGPTIGPFFCGGLATLDSRTGELSYSGQAKAFRHFTHFLQPGARVVETKLVGDGPNLYNYPQGDKPLEASAFRNPDGTLAVVIVNPNGGRCKLQYQMEGICYYVDLLPESLSTVIFEPSAR